MALKTPDGASFPRWRVASDQALLVELGDTITPRLNEQVRRLCAALQQAPLAGVVDLHPAYASVLIRFDAQRLRRPALIEYVEQALTQLATIELPLPRRVIIPVRYGGSAGPDLVEVAALHDLVPEAVVELHAAASYLVYFLGFAPGFAYLGGLPAVLQTPRLLTPRPVVPAGSVGIAGQQTGVYPVAIPGGWRLIGRTPLVLFDPQRTPMSLLQPGDEVQFVPTRGGGKRAMTALRVLSPGLLTTVQDLGRPGHAALGISACGAADAVALRLGNQLVGNPAAAPALEMTLHGATLQFESAAWVALTGGDCAASRVRGSTITTLPMWTVLPMAAGDVLRCGAVREGARTYLCITGGIDVPRVLGSAATHVRSGLGGHRGRALRTGDELQVAVSAVVPRPGHLVPTALDRLYRRAVPRLLRITEGPQRSLFTATSFATLLSAEYVVSPRSDRMGVRLEGPPVVRPSSSTPDHEGPDDTLTMALGELLTEGVYLGAVQVPADGQPIILAVDHQTTGGYPKLASVISADLALLGQLRPAERLRFVEVSLATADDLRAEQEQLIMWDER